MNVEYSDISYLWHQHKVQDYISNASETQKMDSALSQELTSIDWMRLGIENNQLSDIQKEIFFIA